MAQNTKGEKTIAVTKVKNGVSISTVTQFVVEDGRIVADTDKGIVQ